MHLLVHTFHGGECEMPRLFSASVGGLLLTTVLTAQPSSPSDPQPIYRVTVVSRSLEAVNYQHRGGPTPIDFRGTVLLPDAKGSAIVDSHRGSMSIEAKLEHMYPPTRFGREYLTYVLWAISPEGRPRNLGEILVDSSNKAHLKVTTEMLAFGLMITAEPYYSVTTPSDVVVAENVVLPETIGTREEVMAKYELLPRGQYTLNVPPAQFRSFDREQEKLPYDRYEAVLELYQAENAVQIVRALDADRFASDSFSKAVTLLSQAQDMTARKMDPQAIVSAAREATQMAEDARTIAVRRQDVDRREREADRLREQAQLRRQAEEDAAQARADADREDEERIAAERARTDAERERAFAEQQAAQARQSRAAIVVPPPHPTLDRDATHRQYRAQVLAQLNNAIATRDTPRGLIVTVNDAMFEPGNDRLRGGVSGRLANVAAILSSNPGLRVRVEGYADTEELSGVRARSVRAALVANGISGDLVSAIGYGNSRPITEQKSAAGHEQNRRVEIVIYGDSIGNRALWDRPYPLSSQR
jgi:outer membrane protein OmpA-like peptidoglycan-associated protein